NHEGAQENQREIHRLDRVRRGGGAEDRKERDEYRHVQHAVDLRHVAIQDFAARHRPGLGHDRSLVPVDEVVEHISAANEEHHHEQYERTPAEKTPGSSEPIVRTLQMTSPPHRKLVTPLRDKRDTKKAVRPAARVALSL